MPNSQPIPDTPKPLRGIFAPMLTPVHADLSPDVARWIDFSRNLLDSGCHGLCPFGTTSEANSFGLDERMEMLEQLVDAGIPAALLMPGTGTCAIPDTVRLTTHAVKLGCSGVLMLPPFYYKAVSDDGLFRGFAEVIERVGDARLRVYLYHIPPVSQVGFSLALIERLIQAYPGVVAGIKDSSADWNNLQALLTTFPGFGIFTGSERFLLQTLRLGGAGSINAVANVIAALQRRLFDQAHSSTAEVMQEEVNRFRQVYKDFPAIPALKQIMAHLRGDSGWQYVRPPFVEPSAEQVKTLIANLEASGVVLPA
jgi:4-hydroxy-tetrahydrodipicolinate synthase